MRKYFIITGKFWSFLIALAFSATLFACTVVTYSGPPRVSFQGPPHLYNIPGSYVYVVADMDVGIFFYDGYWYRSYNNYWFRASYYNGSWLKVVIGNVPPRLHKLPRTYRQHLKRDAYRIPHRDLKQYYKRWERERYWDKDRRQELKNIKKKYKKKKQDYRREKRRHDSGLRNRIEDSRGRVYYKEEHIRENSRGRVQERRKRVEENREHADKRVEDVREDKAHDIARPYIIKEVKDRKKAGKKKDKGKGKKKGKKKEGDKEQNEEDSDNDDNDGDDGYKKGRGR